MDVGFVTKSTLNRLVASGDASPRDEIKFYSGAKAFFVRAFEYGLARMPLNDPLLCSAKFVNFEERENITFSMPHYFIQR